MKAQDYSNTLNRQRDLYSKMIRDNNRNHKEEMESLNKANDHKVSQQKDAHLNQLTSLEKDYSDKVSDLRDSQQKSLKEKSELFEKTVEKNQREFHDIRKDNLQKWNKKFTDIKNRFDENISQKNSIDAKSRETLKKNYNENLESITKKANTDLNAYVRTRNAEKKESDIQFRVEKEAIVKEKDEQMNQLIRGEREKRNTLTKEIQKEIADNEEANVKRYLASQDDQKNRFSDLKTKLDGQIKEKIEADQQNIAKNQQEQVRESNKKFQDRFLKQEKDYERSLRNTELNHRANLVSQGEATSEIQKKYRDTEKNQNELEKKTILDERADLVENYETKIDDIKFDYQKTLRDQNIKHAEKLAKVQNDLTEVNREEKFDDRIERERMSHEHSLAIDFNEERNVTRLNEQKRISNQKINNLKASFDRSLNAAQEKSKQDFENIQAEMILEKRELQSRLHEQNSKQNAFLKQVYSEKLNKMSAGYETRINELENQVKMQADNNRELIKDIMRKTNLEIERQRQEITNSAAAEVKSEKVLAKKREDALQSKIRDIQNNFTKKNNEQTLAHRKKLKDTTFEYEKKITEEATRYQDIIDQNNKFFNREFQRLKLANEAERDRLISQYESRIAQMERVYKNKSAELEQFNSLERA